MPFIPHTEEELQTMLKAIGANSIDDLFDEIPMSLRTGELSEIPDGINEMVLLQQAAELAKTNTQGICFIGAGSYEHHIPAAVWDITSRGEFLTAYTPYQAEASQGTLQLLYEFQTMIAELTATDVANASVYDGASALAEAVLMAVRMKKEAQTPRILMPETVHPFYRETVESIVRNQQIEIITLPFDPSTGTIQLKTLEAYAKEDITALVIPQPNFFGCLEDVDAMTDWAAQHNIVSIATVNPMSLALLKPPGQWGKNGADIVSGEGQPLGVPMASGGPYFGFLSTRMEQVRQLPGRIIGRTVDKDGKIGFTLTLQAREQHIRRGKANSNICTNQGLLVTAATIYMALMGEEGLKQTALHCHQNTKQLVEQLTQISGVTQAFSTPYFHECLLQFEQPVEDILEALHAKNIAGGYLLYPHYKTLPNTLLVCATEMRTQEEIQLYISALSQICGAFPC